MRVLKWIFERLEKKAGAKKTPVGLIPDEASFDLPQGVQYSALFPCDVQGWKAELEDANTYFRSLGERLPPEISSELKTIQTSL